MQQTAKHGPPGTNDGITAALVMAHTATGKSKNPCKSSDLPAAHEHGQAGSVAGFIIIDQVQAGANTQ